MRLSVKNIPSTVTVALSGGPDSMCVLDFLLRSNRNVRALHFNHGTPNAGSYENFVADYCKFRGISLEVVRLDLASEAEWSRKRKSTFLYTNGTVATGHNLNDAVETWIMTSMRGNQKLLTPTSDNTFRPLLYTPKEDILDWNARKSVPFVVDNTNVGDHNDRARLRAYVLPGMRKIHPGLDKTILNKMIREFGIVDLRDFERKYHEIRNPDATFMAENCQLFEK